MTLAVGRGHVAEPQGEGAILQPCLASSNASAGRAEDVPTLGSVPKTRVLHVRVEPAELAVWRVTAASRGRTLSGLVRELLEDAANERVTQQEEGAGSSLSPQASSRARTLEEKIQAIEKLVDGLGVARPLPHPAEGDAGTEAASALERPLTD
jgi:hypothetical protein